MTTTLNPILPHEPNTASVQRPERLKFAPHILLHSGTWLEQHSAWEDDPLIDGIKLALVHSGQMQCRVAGQAVRYVVQPSLCAFGNLGDYAISHRFQPDIPLRYTILQLESDGQDQHAELFPTALKYRAGQPPKMVIGPASKLLLALSTQIASCPLQGATRDLYLAGKAMELIAMSLQHLSDTPAPATARLRLSRADIERLHAARELLIADLPHPPGLDRLAALVGINTRKLTQGFRQIFGSSVFAWLQEYRLQQAHRMLSSEAANVSTIAYRVGYSPAHLSIAFRKRFGISPSAIVAR
ncbi:helix-turn-helix transcriptional regulator [Serratia proteamaculans]|uniref:helix-turn-helix transcriptional regulator n=1 Tax=Serratia proteamaculans TaxID=28151 RepID=UPI0039B0155E